jgi:hypothetical protein
MHALNIGRPSHHLPSGCRAFTGGLESVITATPSSTLSVVCGLAIVCGRPGGCEQGLGKPGALGVIFVPRCNSLFVDWIEMRC